MLNYAKLRIHLASGAAIDTLVTGAELEDADQEDLDEHVEDLLEQNGKPKWVSLGDVKFHPQAASAIEVLEYDETEET